MRLDSIGRRRFFQAAIAAAAAPIWTRLADAEAVPGDRKRLLAVVSDLVIPDTETPGAVAAGVPDFVVLGLEHGLDGTTSTRTDARGGLALLDALAADLDRRAGGAFLSAAPERRAALLGALDAETFAAGDSAAPWRKIKDLILTGYYTSQTGASKELRYELTPGRFDPDIPKATSDRSWSSDWTAVDFG
jgi:hypothetical protein